ncbi:hypothetical protein ALTERO38_20317 [Alteromonas sp. 38]|nr:hypothetical protein ALTER154_100220 [Alteromonas sp. 154]VXB05720.1 hypothetical protein ALTERO38_20317 [Alteromonas sp. 38]
MLGQVAHPEVTLIATKLGQETHFLNLNLTSFSCLQSSQTTLKIPFSRRPKLRNSSNYLSTC